MTPGPREDGSIRISPRRRALMLVNQTGTRGRRRIDEGLRILETGGIEAEPMLLRTERISSYP